MQESGYFKKTREKVGYKNSVFHNTQQQQHNNKQQKSQEDKQ